MVNFLLKVHLQESRKSMTIIIVAKDPQCNETVVAHAPNFTEARAWFKGRRIGKSRKNSVRWDVFQHNYGEVYLSRFTPEEIRTCVAGEPNHTRTFPASVDHFVLRNVGEVENPDSLITEPTSSITLRHITRYGDGFWVVNALYIDSEGIEIKGEPVTIEYNTKH